MLACPRHHESTGLHMMSMGELRLSLYRVGNT